MNRKKLLERIVGFTLAEVLITMIVIVLMTLASVPVIKKTKEFRTYNNDKNSWVAMYEPVGVDPSTGKINEELVVYIDGAKPSDMSGHITTDADGNEQAIFTPPEGVNKFHVTVVGGGGGGAAGVSVPGTSKLFFSGNNATEFTFMPPNDGVYRIIAIGGGGGGAGGAVACDGTSGNSGGGVIATANLKKNARYGVIVGQGGYGGESKTVGKVLKKMIVPVIIIGAVVAAAYFAPAVLPAVAKSIGMSTVTIAQTGTATLTWVTGSAGTLSTYVGGTLVSEAMVGGFVLNVGTLPILSATVTATTAGIVATGTGFALSAAGLAAAAGTLLTPTGQYKDGGGHAMSTAIYGGPDPSNPDVDIIAGGGVGGVFRSKNWLLKCKRQGRADYLNEKYSTTVKGSAITSSLTVDNNESDRFFCRKDGKLLGGKRGTFCQALDKAIEGGYTNAVTFGDGGWRGGHSTKGRPGSDGYAQISEVSAYGGGGGKAGSVSTYTFVHSPLEKGQTTVPVIVGKGGDGGIVSTVSAPVTVAKQRGQDGGFSRFGTKIIASGGEGGDLRVVNPTQVDNSLFQSKGEDGFVSLVLSSVLKQAKLKNINKTIFIGTEKEGEGTTTELRGNPGLGGAGGGAYSNITTYDNEAFAGGKGSSGMVLVTW